ncbi:hypothetical protein [Fictibacillus arsenicus]|uniref:hypothetical protein n=1 Tax=Fictibacillus arsenicus TaxID=255247 RepID=UPI001115703B|nr:hypothetical protein [Fictibacillus arsenicus]
MRDPREILARIRAQADAATEGPWTAEYSGEQGNCVLPPGYQSTREAVAVTRLLSAQADAEFIAASRTTVPRLVDALRAVLELHVRAECPTCGSRDGEGNEFHKCDDDAYCEECDLEGYPCPTVTAITRALEGEPHD